MLECVVNVSEGRDPALVRRLAGAGAPLVLDVHSDAAHHRSVITMAGPPGELEEAVRRLAVAVVQSVDIGHHEGAHPRIGALDVVPWVELAPAAAPATGATATATGATQAAVGARDRFARWAGDTLELPCFLYGPERTLPEVRRRAWKDLLPDTGPRTVHPSAGAAAVGARGVLVAYNLWLAEAALELARRIAAELRGPALRTLALDVGGAVQVSCNLIDPWRLGPEVVFDAVASRGEIARAELVGLVPAAVLGAIPSSRHAELGLEPSSTIEARLEEAGPDGGSLPAGPGD
ncbi:MAG: hypothetical protein ACR2KC_06730 [Acidimicrobiales bacterium]